MSEAPLCNASATGSNRDGEPLRKTASLLHIRRALLRSMLRREKVKRKIVVVGLLALVVSFGGRWMTRTEPAEETRPVISYESVKAESEPTPPTLLIQSQDVGASSGQ